MVIINYMGDIDLEILRNKIEKLEKFHQIEIFNIIYTNQVAFTENRNGVFINMAKLDKNIIQKITTYLSYVDKQLTQLETTEELKQHYIKTYFIQQKKDNKELSTNIVL